MATEPDPPLDNEPIEPANDDGPPLRIVEPDEGAPVLFLRGDHVEVGARLIADLSTDEAPVFCDGAIHRYNSNTGVWTPVEHAELSRRIQSYAGAGVGKKGVLKLRHSDMKGSILFAYDKVADPNFFADHSGLTFTNGHIVIADDGLQMVPLAPTNRARHGFGFPYAVSETPRWMSFLEETFSKDADRVDRIKLIQEVGGAALFGVAPMYQKALVLLGNGGEGKSVILRILGAAMPHGSTCAIAPQDFKDEYRKALIAGKLLNYVSEMPEADIIESTAVKAIIDGTLTTARHIYFPPFDFAARAMHVFACNRLPAVNDSSHGFWRRWILLEFTRVVPDEEQDERLADRIIKEELPGIVCWFARGGDRLLRNGHFTIPASSALALSAWRTSADQVRQFIAECCRDAADHERLPLERVYQAYRAWASRSGHRNVLNSSSFSQKMKAAGKGAIHTRLRNVYPVALLTDDETNGEGL